MSVLVNEFEVVPGQHGEQPPAGQQSQQQGEQQKVSEPEVERMLTIRHERHLRLEAD
jgi:hypothetical protein